MSLVSFVDNLVGNLIPSVESATSSAVSTAEKVNQELQDDVTKGLTGEASGESSQGDTFVSTASAQKGDASALDGQIKENETNIKTTEGELTTAEGELTNATANVATAEGELTNANALLAIAKQNAQSQPEVQDGAQSGANDGADAIRKAETAVKSAEKNVADAKVQEKEAETKKENLEEDLEGLNSEKDGLDGEAQSLQGDAQSNAGNGQSTESEAQGTESDAESYYAEHKDDNKEVDENGNPVLSNDDAIEASKAGEGENANKGEAPVENGDRKVKVTVNGKEIEAKYEVQEDGTIKIITDETYTNSDEIVVEIDGKPVVQDNVQLQYEEAKPQAEQKATEGSTSATTTPTTTTAAPTATAPAETATTTPAEGTQKPANQVEKPEATQQTTQEEPAYYNYPLQNFFLPDASTRIDMGFATDMDMAYLMVNDMFSVQVGVSADEVVGMNANDALLYLGEAAKTEAYSKAVYTTNISTNTDTASVEENQEAISDFIGTYNDTAAEVQTPNVEFLSLTDKSNFEAAKKMLDRLNNGEYILTKEIKSETTAVESIQVSSVDSHDQEQKRYNTKGLDVLSQLQGKITDKEDAEDNPQDDVLTENEYYKMENFFKSSEDKTAGYESLIKDARQYGIYASIAA